jgi:stalled ribosome alternative rescue factor ArfA
MKKRNPIAKALRTPLFKQRTVETKKTYKRRSKHVKTDECRKVRGFPDLFSLVYPPLDILIHA